MASPCEVLVDPADHAQAAELLRIAREEAWRIERTFSRYRGDSVVAAIHAARGQHLEVDAETADLLDFADQCYRLSDGRFDITSGVLREVWRFDGSDRIPTREAVARILPRVGWEKVLWRRPRLRLPEGMEIDLGGIAKEYAVDRCAALLGAVTPSGYLVNFGGDLRAGGRRTENLPWTVGVERPDVERAAGGTLRIRTGACATSGDTRRYHLAQGVRYSHILNPLTGWPVEGAPRSVTVLADTCTEAGMLATFAQLQGPNAGTFLEEQGLKHWCQW